MTKPSDGVKCARFVDVPSRHTKVGVSSCQVAFQEPVRNKHVLATVANNHCNTHRSICGIYLYNIQLSFCVVTAKTLQILTTTTVLKLLCTSSNVCVLTFVWVMLEILSHVWRCTFPLTCYYWRVRLYVLSMSVNSSTSFAITYAGRWINLD